MSTAIVLRAHGAAEELRPETVDVGTPGAGEIRVRQTAIGVNYHDVYVRSGLYRTLALPGIPGIEGVGVVEALGEGVDGLAMGQRVGYISPQYGAYAAVRLLPADQVLPLPPDLEDAAAAAFLLKALTAEMLVRRVHRVAAGETVLVHAAAGGVGRLVVQWASRLGATVIGTAGSEAKAAIAMAAGATHVIRYREQDVAAEVKRLTDGRGADVVYDSVGIDTFDGSLDSLATLGHLVNFGQSSGPPAPLPMARLATRSLTVTRPMVFHWFQPRSRYREMAAAAFAALADGTLTAEVGRSLPLREAAAAHALLESRTVAGPVVLVPEPTDA
ncbi:MAG: quinone oxidoreductase [Chloroflexota bacterium]